MADNNVQFEGRLDRIEDKIDKLSDAIISIARAEERIVAIEQKNVVIYERQNKQSEKLDRLETDLQEAKMTTSAVNKLFWVIITGVVGAVIAVITK